MPSGRGLGVRVTAGARKSSMEGKTYLCQYRRAGQKHRIPLGSCKAISLKAAREAVLAILGDVARGLDPDAKRKQDARDAKKRADVEALTLGVLIDKWEARHLSGKRPGYAIEAPRALRFAFKKHLTSPAANLTPKVVKATLNAIADFGKKATARLTGAYGRACYGWAIDEELLTENPFAGLKLEAVPSRDRVLSDPELAAVWKATEAPGPYNRIVRLLLLTGQRRDEVAAMTWEEIAPDLSTWTIPGDRAKNGKAHIVPLSPQAQAILRAAPRFDRDGDDGPELVFPGRGGTFNGFSKAKKGLNQAIAETLKADAKERGRPEKAAAPARWTLHDLRRTCATGLQKLGVRLEVTEAALNHVSGSRAGVVGIYQRHDWADEKRAALTAWGARVAATIEGGALAGNVVRLAVSA